MTFSPVRRGLCLFTAVCLAALPGELVAENTSLSRTYPKEELARILLPRDGWHPFPKAAKRAAWEAIPEDARNAIVAEGEAYSRQEVPPLPATLYLEFRRVGNRSRYQDVWLVRRQMLHALALAECVEGKGRFLDPLADVVWAICEESSWTWPAHIGAQRAGVDLPDTTEPIVALFSAETGSALAWTVYLLEDELDTVSPQICRRAVREVDQRIVTPYLDREDFGWMGFSSRGRPNNWNPWVNSNVLAAALLLEKDEARRLEVVHKVLRSVDNFLVPYPADGSCDEGPSYWSRAGASLFDNLEWLSRATDGRVNLYADPAVKEIGRFILRTHIAGDYFVNVGDCDARIDFPRDLVFRYGARIGDPDLQALGASELDREALCDTPRLASLGRTLPMLFNLEKLLSAEKSPPPLVRDVWLAHPDLQLMAARDTAGSTDGLYVAAWGAHNGQSHNHNDVGNFVLYADGRPMVIDVGRPTYTRQTFSRDRYQIWAMQSGYHNLPTVNGCTQKPGAQYAAKDVRYTVDEAWAQLEMDIAPGYPREAGVVSWVRTVRLARGDGVTVSDTFQLKEPTDSIVLSLMTPCEVSEPKPGRLELRDAESGTAVGVEYGPPQLAIEVETVELEDAKLTEIWGPRLYRILLRADSPQAQGTWTLRFSPK